MIREVRPIDVTGVPDCGTCRKPCGWAHRRPQMVTGECSSCYCDRRWREHKNADGRTASASSAVGETAAVTLEGPAAVPGSLNGDAA